MIKENSLVPIPEDEPLLERGEVTSATFPNFLVGFSDYFPYKHWDFAPELDLSGYTSIFEQLYQERQQVHVYSEEIRSIWDQRQKEKKVMGDMEEENYFWNRKDDAERSMTLFFNTDEGRYFTTPVTQGEHSRVKFSTLDHMSNTMIPLLELHTHSTDSLPSQVDFARLITKGYEDGRSIVRGIMILCPTQQILALPNSRISPFSPEKSSQLIDDADKEYYGECMPLEEKRVKRIARIGNAITSRAEVIFSKADEAIETIIERRENDGAISQAEGVELRKEIIEDVKDYQEWLSDHQLYLGNTTNIQYGTKLNYADNLLLMKFARQLDIQFYSSTDMQHFTKWTA